MKDPRTTKRTRFDNVQPPSIEDLRAAILARAGGRQNADRARADLFAYVEALAAGRASISPAAARLASRGETRSMPRKSIVPGLPD